MIMQRQHAAEHALSDLCTKKLLIEVGIYYLCWAPGLPLHFPMLF